MTDRKLEMSRLPVPGDRVRLTGVMPEDPDPLPIGTTGSVTAINPDTHQIIVTWDFPRSLILLTTDPFEIIDKEPEP